MPNYIELNAITQENPIEITVQGVTYTASIDVIYARGQAPYESHFINFNLNMPGDRVSSLAKRRAPFAKSKFHISLPELNKDEADSDFARGFEIVVNILAKHKIRHFKVVRPGIKLSEQVASQRGKEFTIYCKENPTLTERCQWEDIAQEITLELTCAGVQPGYPAITTQPGQRLSMDMLDLLSRAGHPVVGSNYMTYRLEDSVDRLRGMRVDVPNQLEPTPWQPQLKDSEDKLTPKPPI